MRHAEVADNEVVLRARDAREAFLAVEDSLHLVSLLAEHVDDQLRDRWLVFDHENAAGDSGARLPGRGRGIRGLVRGGNGNDGQIDRKFYARSWLAFESDFPPMLADDAVHNREPEPGAHAGGLGREKRIENPRRDFGSDARSVV